jgi:hypothetical protein
MGKVIENFRDELAKLAQAVEIIESTFVSNSQQEINVTLDENTFISLMQQLGRFSNENKCIISLGNTQFTFLKR